MVTEDQRRAGTSTGHGGDAADPGELQKAPAAEAPVHRATMADIFESGSARPSTARERTRRSLARTFANV